MNTGGAIDHEKRPLSRFLICGGCSHRLTGYGVKKRKVHYYKCNKCRGASYNAETSKRALTEGLNDKFFSLLDHYVLKEDMLPKIKLTLSYFLEREKNKSLLRIKNLNKEIREVELKLTQLDDRYWLSKVTLSAEKYKGYQDQLRTEKAIKESEMAKEEKKVSNQNLYLDEVLYIALQGPYLWASADLEKKIFIQKTVFPDDLVIRPVNRTYLTSGINAFFRIIPLFTRVIERHKIKKVTISDDFLSLVDRNIELSNLDALFDRSRQYLIWDELAEFELLELDYLETFPFLENK
jgi:hypothetical protein